MKHDLVTDVLMTEVDMWAEIYRLREAVKGPEGYNSWQHAATEERIRRVKAENKLKAYKSEVQKYFDDIDDIVRKSKW
jgi:hypothetical protein